MKSNTTYSVLALVLVLVFASCSYQALDVPEFSGEEVELTDLDSRMMGLEASREHALKNIKKVFENLNKGKYYKLLDYLDENVVWTIDGEQEGVTPLAGTYNGKEEVRSYFDAFFSMVKLKKITIQYHLIQDNKINSHVTMEGKVLSTGKTFSLEFIYAWELNESKKIAKLFAYYCTYSWNIAFTKGGDSHVTDFRTNENILTLGKTNVTETAQTLYAKFGAGDIEGLKALFVENGAQWVLKGDAINVPYAGVFNEKEGIQRFFDGLFASNGYVSFNLQYWVEEGNIVDFHADEVCYSLKTGEYYSCNFVHTFVVNKEGQLVSWKSTNSSYAVSEAHTPD